MTTWSPVHSPAAYTDITQALWAWTHVLTDLVHELADEGCRHIQLDAPDLTFPIGDWARTLWAAGFHSHDQVIEVNAAAINHVAAAAANRGVTTSLHICRGNDQGRYHTSGGYASISTLFQQITHVDELFLEYDSTRTGNFDALQHVPDDKHVVLGLISTKSNELETPGAVIQQIKAAALHHPIEQLGLSTQCGFASVISGNPITAETQRDKLTLVQNVARQVWP